jgi:hypothetical protein
MNLDEWRTVQETEPATPRQVGAVMGEFKRLGYGRAHYDRTARLAVTARILGLDVLASTKGLTMGEAGSLMTALRGFASRAALDARFPSPAARKARDRAQYREALAGCLAACDVLPWDRAA